MRILSRFAATIGAAALVAGCGTQNVGTLPRGVASAAQPTHSSKSYLYVGSTGPVLSKYSLDDSKPLRSIEPQNAIAMVLDSSGNLLAETGNISHGFISVYDARSLKTLRGINGIWATSLAVDPDGYIYAANCGSGIAVLAPGGTAYSHTIYHHVRSACAVAVDPLGTLYVANAHWVSVYGPTKKPGYPKFQRRITDGIRFPSALAFDSADNLYVANCVSCIFSNTKRDWVSVYAPGGSAPIRKLTIGIKSPGKLTVNSAGRLYVANSPFTREGYQHGWIAVYGPDRGNPIEKISAGIDVPADLAIDSSGKLYVADKYSDAVTVYLADGTKPVRTITDGVKGPVALAITPPRAYWVSTGSFDGASCRKSDAGYFEGIGVKIRGC